MPLTLLGFHSITRVQIGNVELDVALSEEHRFPASLTENPVEDGTVFTDHVVLQPVVLEIEGRISDATQNLASFRGLGTSSSAFKALVILQKSRQPFRVVTKIATYENMMFEELSVPRVALDGRSIRFNATLKEILVVGEDAETNRDRIADNVKHTALASRSNGITTKVLLGP